jgi:tRNA dimethylallyltransferase
MDAMLAGGAIEEARALLPRWDAAMAAGLPATRAIGAAGIVAHLRGDLTLEAARERAVIDTRRYAKRQRTWFRARMSGWRAVPAARAADVAFDR